MNSDAIRAALVAVMVFSVFVATTLSASASATADNFGAEDASGYKNTNVLVPVNITNAHSESIVGIEFKFMYDSSVITIAEMQKGALTSQWCDPLKTGTDGDYVIAIVGTIPDAITNGLTGSVVVLNFSVVGESGETSPMNLTNIKLVNISWDETGTAPAKNGTFAILTPTPTPTPTSTGAVSSGGGGSGDSEESYIPLVTPSSTSLTLTPATISTPTEKTIPSPTSAPQRTATSPLTLPKRKVPVFEVLLAVAALLGFAYLLILIRRQR